MIEFNESTCTGCRACEKVCPIGCISIEKNRNGFLEPKVDQKKCIGCGICKATCPVENKIDKYRPLHVYAAYGLKTEAINNSTSGGIFYTIASEFIANGGIVFGAAYKDMYLQIMEATTQGQLINLQGSKYIQADTVDTYKRVQNYLKEGKKVLYSGTPCQIAGLRSLLRGTDSSNLFTIEIICHGVSSPKMFQDYLEWRNNQTNKKVVQYQFRPKLKNGRDFRCVLCYEDGTKEILLGFKDPFYKKYMEGNSYRKICYECPFSQKNRVADITLGDFWNIQDVNLKFGGSNRVSVVLLNSQASKKVWDSIKEKVSYIETEWEIAYKGNPNLGKISGEPDKYFPYGEIENPMKYFDSVMMEPLNRRKMLFNMLPPIIRKIIKIII